MTPEGSAYFVGPDLEGLDSKPARCLDADASNSHRPLELFSDLNQWMLKILIGQRLPDQLISVPMPQIRNASQLASWLRVLLAERQEPRHDRGRFLPFTRFFFNLFSTGAGQAVVLRSAVVFG